MTMTSKHAVYEMEENYATIVERFRCHLTEEQGLVWCGLPSMSPIQWEPSTTVIKVTNTHTHTHTHTHTLKVGFLHCWISIIALIFAQFVEKPSTWDCRVFVSKCKKVINTIAKSLKNVCIMRFQCYCPDTKHETQSSSSSLQRYHVL
jgi:hypothetical protein